MQSRYHGQFVQRKPVYNQFTNQTSYVESMVSGFELAYEDIGAFASRYGVKKEHLQATLESRMKEVVTSDKRIIRAYPFSYVEKRPRGAPIEDEAFIKAIAAKNERNKAAAPAPVSTLHGWEHMREDYT